MDFTFIRGSTADKPQKRPAEPLLMNERAKISQELKTRLERLTGATETEQAPQLTRVFKKEKEDKERSFNAYKEYQNNIRAAGQLRADILKGTKEAEDSADLLLKACKCISLMTGDKLFYSQIEADIVSIYGIGLGEKGPIRKELEDVSRRLERLKEAEKTETQPDSKARIAAAIKAHESRAYRLKELITK